MTEDEFLIAHVRDLKTKCADNSIITHTNFLDMRQRTVLSFLKKEQAEFVKTVIWGGFDDSERAVMIFIPRFYESFDPEEIFEDDPDLCPITVLRADKDKFSVLSHRDYLGALMGLSIKRELIGDIIIDENGAYIICLKSIEHFITENLTSAGRATLTVKSTSFSDIKSMEFKTKEIFSSVASTRLDCIVSSAFSISRTKAVSAIESGITYVNGLQILKPDYKINEGDKIVLRGKGKAVLSQIKGESKKGRLHIIIKKFI